MSATAGYCSHCHFRTFLSLLVAASEESDDDITILDDVNRSPPDADDD